MRGWIRWALFGGAMMVWAAAALAGDCPRPLLMSLPAVRADTPLDQLAFAMREKLEKKAGLRIEIRPMTRVRAQTEFLAGRIDLFPMGTRSAERDEGGTLVPQGSVKAMLIMPRARAATPVSREDLVARGLNVTNIRGQHFGARSTGFLADLAKAGKLQTVSDPGSAIRMLKAGRTDAVYGLALYFDAALRAEGWLDEIDVVDADIGDPIEFGAYVSHSTPRPCLEALARAEAEFRATGVIDEQVRRLFPAKLRAGLRF